MDRQIVRTLAEAVAVLLGENFDAFLVEGKTALALEQATNARQHFPSLKIVCLVNDRPEKETLAAALSALFPEGGAESAAGATSTLPNRCSTPSPPRARRRRGNGCSSCRSSSRASPA